MVVVAFAHVTAGGTALNYFDPPKRLAWALLATVLALLPRNRRAARTSVATGLAVALLAWMVARTLLRPNPTVELGVLITWMLPVLLFVLSIGRTDGRGIRWFGLLLGAMGYLQALLMILQRVGLDPLFAATTGAMEYAPGRMVGTIGYHNQAVDFLGLACAGILMADAKAWVRLAWMVPLLVTALLTGNRGGALAFACALAVVLALLARTRRRALCRNPRGAVAAFLVCLMGTAALVLSLPEIGPRFREVLTQPWASPAVRSRLLMARIGLDMVREMPLTGWGAGEYAFQYLDRLGDALPAVKPHALLRSVVFAREAHNDPIQFTAEFGLVGLALLLALAVCTWHGIAAARTDDGDRAGPAGLVLAYMAAASLFSFPWQAAMAGPLAGLSLGLLTPSRPTNPPTTAGKQPGTTLSTVAGRGAYAVLLGLAMAVLAWSAWDAFVNVAVPSRIAAGSGVPVPALPSVAHRYHALVGASCAAHGDFVAALERLTHAERGYRDILLWNNLGHVLAKTGRWKEARDVYLRWAASGIDHCTALENLSVAHENLREYAEAADALYGKLRLQSVRAPADVKRLAALFLRAGDLVQADHVIWRFQRSWMASSPRTRAELENLAGSIALLHGDRDDAVRLFEAALSTDPGLDSARRNLGTTRDTATSEISP